jgi:hypothetical protein
VVFLQMLMNLCFIMYFREQTYYSTMKLSFLKVILFCNIKAFFLGICYLFNVCLCMDMASMACVQNFLSEKVLVISFSEFSFALL